MAFCVECGTKIESEWKFCGGCSAPVKKVGEKKKTAEVPDNHKIAERILDPLSYGHWLVTGKPLVIESYGEVIEFDLKNIEARFWFDYLAYARYWVGKKGYKTWVHTKYPVLGLIASFTELPKPPKDSKEVDPKNAASQLNEYALGVWKKAGKPRIAISPTKPDEIFFLDWLGWFQWKKVVEPLTEKELLAPFSSAEKNLKDEDEIIELLDRDEFKKWKKRDRPPLVKSFGTVYYKTQLDFKKLFEIEMPPLLLDIWYLAGEPRLKGWNYIEATEEYLGELQQQQAKGSIWSSIAQGFSEFSNGLAEGANSVPKFNFKEMPSNPQEGLFKCTRCGTPLRDMYAYCPHCQVTSFGFK